MLDTDVLLTDIFQVRSYHLISMLCGAILLNKNTTAVWPDNNVYFQMD